MALRCFSEYETQADGPERSEYFHVVAYGPALEVWSEEILKTGGASGDGAEPEYEGKVQ